MTWPVVALISVLCFWTSLAILLTKWPRSRNKSISQHSAAQKESFIFFTAAQSIIGFILYLFVIRWFIPTFHMSLLFTIVYTTVAWLQIISAFIPDTMTGKVSLWHRRLANSFAVGMIVVTMLLCFTPTIHGWPKTFLYLTAVCMLFYAAFGSSANRDPSKGPNYLAAQTLYIVIFQLAFLAATFYG